MACWHSPPSLNELLFAKMNAWKSVVLPDLCVLHLELTDLARAYVEAVFALGAIGIPG